MNLAVSTATAPMLSLNDFETPCAQRGLDGVERSIAPHEDLAAVIAEVQASPVRVVALRASSPTSLPPLLRAAATLGLPISLPLDALGSATIAQLCELTQETNATLLLGVGTDLARAAQLMSALTQHDAPASIGISWEISPNTEDLAPATAVLLSIAPRLGLVRLYGGGPEQREQDGKGIGTIFQHMTLLGVRAPVVMTPSSPAALPRWADWLASRKIIGCGSAHPAGEHELDVRDVEPKDRLGSILGAFAALPAGQTLKVTLDHDPSCMYYMLEDSQPQGSFAFKKVLDGPEVWSAEVTRQAPAKPLPRG